MNTTEGSGANCASMQICKFAALWIRWPILFHIALRMGVCTRAGPAIPLSAPIHRTRSE